MINKSNSKSFEKIASLIRSDLIKNPSWRAKRIFLCGGSIRNNKSIRYKIQNYLSSKNGHTILRYDISYPEDLFDEILNSGKYDLLTLESLLAESVDVIIIVVESVGAIAELGAFISDKKLIKKTIVINDSQFKKDKSFINQGPIKLLKSVNSSAVNYLDFKSKEIDFDPIVKSINSIEISNSKDNKLTLLNLETFVMPLLYISNSLHKDDIKKMISFVIDNDNFLQQITISVLGSMVKKKLIEKNNDYYRLSVLGIRKFKDKFFSFELDKIDNIRIDFLSLTYRNKRVI